jgi:tetratricopeptide (TPR) repeat protein
LDLTSTTGGSSGGNSYNHFINSKMLKTMLIVMGWLFGISVYAGTCPDGSNIATERDKNYSLYREFFKQNLYADAMPYWKWVYANAPGIRKQTYIDGVEMYTAAYKATKDENAKTNYLDTIMQIYDKRIECFGEASFVTGRKAYDIATIKPTIGGFNDARVLYEKAFAQSSNEIAPYMINQYMSILLNLRGAVPGIDDAYATEKYNAIVAHIDKKVADASTKDVADFTKLKSDLANLYDQYLKPKGPVKPWFDGIAPTEQITLLSNQLKNNPSDIKNVKEVYEKALLAKDIQDSTIRSEIELALYSLEPNTKLATSIGYRYYKLNKNYKDAITYFSSAMEMDTSMTNKAQYAMTVADCYYRLNKFTESRESARKAISYNPNMGQAYYWIGVLYASSGKLCGPGTGFESQKVLWPAFDYFYKAKAVDPSVAADCDKMIADYKPFLPSKEDILKRKLKEGQQYNVGCWINESATVRAKK